MCLGDVLFAGLVTGRRLKIAASCSMCTLHGRFQYICLRAFLAPPSSSVCTEEGPAATGSTITHNNCPPHANRIEWVRCGCQTLGMRREWYGMHLEALPQQAVAGSA